MPISGTEPVDRTEVAGRVRRLRAEHGWYQKDLAERADVGLRTLAAVEAAEERPVSDVIYGRIAKALGVPLSALLGEES